MKLITCSFARYMRNAFLWKPPFINGWLSFFLHIRTQKKKVKIDVSSWLVKKKQHAKICFSWPMSNYKLFLFHDDLRTLLGKLSKYGKWVLFFFLFCGRVRLHNNFQRGTIPKVRRAIRPCFHSNWQVACIRIYACKNATLKFGVVFFVLECKVVAYLIGLW